MRSWRFHYRDKTYRSPCISGDNAILNTKKKKKEKYVFYVNSPLTIISTIQNIVRVRSKLACPGFYVRMAFANLFSISKERGNRRYCNWVHFVGKMFTQTCVLSDKGLYLKKRLFSILQCPGIIDNDETIQSAAITPL